jgi:hypothetical protein
MENLFGIMFFSLILFIAYHCMGFVQKRRRDKALKTLLYGYVPLDWRDYFNVLALIEYPYYIQCHYYDPEYPHLVAPEDRETPYWVFMEYMVDAIDRKQELIGKFGEISDATQAVRKHICDQKTELRKGKLKLDEIYIKKENL